MSRRGIISWHLSVRNYSALLCLGSWLLLCILDVAAANWDTGYSERVGISSYCISFAVLVVSGLAFGGGHLHRYFVQRQYAARRWKHQSVVPEDQQDESHPPEPSRFHMVLWSVSVHSTLLLGAVAWVINVVLTRQHPQAQVLLGLSTLYSIATLTALPLIINAATQSVLDGAPDREAEEPSRVLLQVRSLSNLRTATRWKPLFKDPTFNGEIVKLQKVGGRGSLVNSTVTQMASMMGSLRSMPTGRISERSSDANLPRSPSKIIASETPAMSLSLTVKEPDSMGFKRLVSLRSQKSEDSALSDVSRESKASRAPGQTTLQAAAVVSAISSVGTASASSQAVARPSFGSQLAPPPQLHRSFSDHSRCSAFSDVSAESNVAAVPNDPSSVKKNFLARKKPKQQAPLAKPPAPPPPPRIVHRDDISEGSAMSDVSGSDEDGGPKKGALAKSGDSDGEDIINEILQEDD